LVEHVFDLSGARVSTPTHLKVAVSWLELPELRAYVKVVPFVPIVETAAATH
jgi:hypothetical protein